jgi:4-hydroxybenzoate polyprenyltransferase
MAIALDVGPNQPRFFAIGGIILLTQVSISALNDWADRAADRAAGRWRPIAMAMMTPRFALGIAVIAAAGAVVATLPFGLAASATLIAGITAGWAYDLWLKPTAYSFVPFAVAFPLLVAWVALIAGRPLIQFGYLLAGGAVLAVGIHLADSLPDLDLDRAAGLRSLAVRLGRDRTLQTMLGCLFCGVMIASATLTSQTLLFWGLALLAIAGTAAAGVVARRRPVAARWAASSLVIVAAVYVIRSSAHV